MPKPAIEVTDISFTNFAARSNNAETFYSFNLGLGIKYTTADVSNNLPALTGGDTQYGGIKFDISATNTFVKTDPDAINTFYNKIIHCSNSIRFDPLSSDRTTLTIQDLSGIGSQVFARTIDISYETSIFNGPLGDLNAPPKSLSLTAILSGMGLNNASSSKPFIFSLHGDISGSDDTNSIPDSIDLSGSATVARLLAAAAGPQFNAPVPYGPPPGSVSAPTDAKAYLGASRIWLSWADTANTSLVDVSNNIYYQVQFQDVTNNKPFKDVLLGGNTTDTDIDDASGNVALFRKTNATFFDLSFNITYKFRVRAGRFNRIKADTVYFVDTAIANANMSAFTDFAYYSEKGALLAGQTGLFLRNRVPEVDFSSAIIDNTRSVYLPPGTYEVGNGGSSFIGNNALLLNNTFMAFAPYQTRWTITDTLNKTYAARQSNYRTTDFSTNVTAAIPPMDISASFALSNGVYTFKGFPLDTIRADDGKILIDAFNSWPVVVLQQKSTNKVAVSGVDVTKNTNTGTNAKYNKNNIFKNIVTNEVVVPTGIRDTSLNDSFYSFADAGITNATDTRYVSNNSFNLNFEQIPYTNQEDVSHNVSKRAILVKGLDAVPPSDLLFQTNLAEISTQLGAEFAKNGAAFASLGVDHGTNGNGWLALLPQITTYFPDLSNAAASRSELITAIANGTVFPDASGSNPSKLGLYTQSVTIKVDSDFSNNKIHFWDPIWGWNTQGYNMFTYQGAVVAPSVTIPTSAIPAPVNNTIDLTTVLTNAYGAENLITFGAGGDAAASRNAQTILRSLAVAKVDLSNPNVSVTVPANLFPFSTAFTTAINSGSTITNVRLFNAGSAYATATVPTEGRTGKITSLPILEVTGTATQGFYVNMDTAGDAITFTSNDGNVTITLRTTKVAGVTNQYTVTGFDAGSLVTGTPTAGNNAIDGATFTFLGVPFFLGTVAGGGVLANATTICFQRGTRILTPSGYKPVEELLSGDRLIDSHNGTVPVRSMIKFIGKKEEGALYCLPKDSLKKNKPLNDLYMSGDHAFKHNGTWRHMNCASGEKFPGKKSTYQTEQDDIEYYHIIIDDYFAHTIIAEGVEVETCFEDKDDGVMMAWACNEKCCTPMKYEAPKPKTPVLQKKNVMSMLDLIPRKITAAPRDSEANSHLLGNKKLIKKSMMAWKYDRKLERNTAVQCNEISLPN
jgi:hypothetical protein